jgi:Helicase HerA, central domain
VHLLAGATRPDEAIRIGALLGTAADLARTPYTIVPGTAVSDLDATWAAGTGSDDDLGGTPFEASSEVLALLGRPPARELPGVRVVDACDFDSTPEVRRGLPLGRVLDRNLRPSGQFQVSTATLNRHVLVCGATGSGKSQTVRTLLEQLAVVAFLLGTIPIGARAVARCTSIRAVAARQAAVAGGTVAGACRVQGRPAPVRPAPPQVGVDVRPPTRLSRT